MANQEEFEKDFEKKFGMSYESYLIRQGKGLKMSRVPEQYKARFIEIAEQEFCSDYGMAIREMVRVWDGVFLKPNQELELRIDVLANQIIDLRTELAELKSRLEPEEKKDANKNYIVKRTGG